MNSLTRPRPEAAQHLCHNSCHTLSTPSVDTVYPTRVFFLSFSSLPAHQRVEDRRLDPAFYPQRESQVDSGAARPSSRLPFALGEVDFEVSTRDLTEALLLVSGHSTAASMLEVGCCDVGQIYNWAESAHEEEGCICNKDWNWSKCGCACHPLVHSQLRSPVGNTVPIFFKNGGLHHARVPWLVRGGSVTALWTVPPFDHGRRF